MNLVKNAYRFGIIAVFGIFILAACSGGKDNRSAAEATSALVNANKNIIAFGHVSVQELLDKLDYKHLPKVNAILQSELTMWKRGLELGKPFYFAVQAPIAEDGTPALVYGLMDVHNKDSLIDKLTSMGYNVEKTGEISFIHEGDVTVGVRNELAIVLSKKGDYDGKAEIEAAFLATEGDESKGKTADILQAKGDIVSGLSLERLYSTSNTMLSKLDETRKKELEGLVADGFVQTTASFEKGKAVIKSKNLFSDALKDRLFFKEDASASVLKKLGNGNAWMGVSANIDVRKLEAFMRDFTPDGEQQLTKMLPGEASMAFAMVGENPLGKLFSGQFGFVAVGDPKAAAGMVPQFNFFVGLGSKGDFINNMITQYATMGGMAKQGDAFVTDGMAIAPRKDGLYGYTVSSATSGGLNIPGFAKDFGKKTFSMFIDFSQMDLKMMELDNEAKVLEIMQSVVINADREGGEMILTAKDQSSNILKQVGLFYMEMGQSKIQGLTL